MSNLAKFSQQIRSFNKLVEKEAESLIGRVLMVVQHNAVTLTPIDTSRARTNWVPTIGAPATSEVPFVMGSHGSTASEAYQTAMTAAAQISKQVKLGQKLWISNNVFYITDLNYGSSVHSPHLMAERAVEAGRNTK